MDVRILGWRYKNIRGGLHDLEIKLGDASTPPRWSLIQMPNGVGKTTTMSLLRIALTGRQPPEGEIRDLRASDGVTHGEFEVRMTIDSKPYRIQVGLNFAKDACTFQTVRTGLSGGTENGHLLPESLKSLLTPAFSRLIVFDGELAKKIRDLEQEHAAQAIRTLYHLDHLRALEGQIGRLLGEAQEQASAVTTAKTDQGLQTLKTKRDNAQAKLQELEAQLRRLRKGKQSREERREALERLLRERVTQDKEQQDRQDRLQREREEAQLSVVTDAQKLLTVMRNPAAIHPRILGRLQDLGGKLDRLKLPKTMSAEFFYELAESTVCVCGRPIGTSEKKQIRARASSYLAENEIAVLNAVKFSVRNQQASNNDIGAETESLLRSVSRRQKANNAWDKLQIEIESNDEDEARAIRTELDQLKATDEEADKIMEELTSTDPEIQRGLDWEMNIPLCKQELATRRESLETATKTVRLRRQSEATCEILARIRDTAFSSLQERIRRATNEKLRRFIKIEDVEVARIDTGLALTSSKIRSKLQVSEGQSLSIAYAFLTSLFEAAPYNLPFIVDSPAVSLDNEVRREVGTLVPDLFRQMIAFIISSERSGFADAFYGRKDVCYLTVWREQSDRTTVNSQLDFFRQFHARDDELEEHSVRNRGKKARAKV